MCDSEDGQSPGGIPVCAGPDPEPRVPQRAFPALTCDTHMHVFGALEVYPMIAERTYTPPEASLNRYEMLAGVLGQSRVVMVQPSVYGTDNRCTLDAVRDTHLDARAVVVVDADIDDRELSRLHDAGTRGIRINLLFAGGVEFATAEALADRLREFGWHIQVLIDVGAMSEVTDRLAKLDVSVVYDHMGHVSTDRGLGDPGFQSMLRQVADGRAWVKLSGSYRVTGESHPPYRDVSPIARALVEANPERCLWGTDWPHPGIAIPMPNDGSLVDEFDEWMPDDARRRQILVDNPASLYGFPSAVD